LKFEEKIEILNYKLVRSDKRNVKRMNYKMI